MPKGYKQPKLTKPDTVKLLNKLFDPLPQYPPYIPQDVYAPFTYGTNTGVATPQVFNPDEHAGKFCAHVNLTYHGVEYTGILFVKKCGHWKLMEYNGNKLAGGTSGSFDAECKKGTLKIEVIRVLFDIEKPIVQPKEPEGYGELDILDIIGETGLEIS